MEQNTLYSHAHPHYYETIARLPLSTEYADRLQALVPEGWRMQRWDIWLGAKPPAGDAPAAGDAATQGFKIHISSTPLQAARVLDLVVPECASRGVSFKIAGDPRLLAILISKSFSRGGSGKFMTIYPPTEAEFRTLIEAIYERTRDEGLAGPYILSDRRYKDSKIIYYRYGGFSSRTRLNADGTRTSMIVTPSGDAIPDERTPYFQLPEWVRDPFGGPSALQEQGTTLLKGRYDVRTVVAYSNAGGVYNAVDTTTGADVIVKEARPHAHFWASDSASLDAVTLREREYRVLQRLYPLGLVPEPIDYFREWEHTFLVEGYVPGRTFQQFFAHDEVIVGPFVRRAGRIERFVPTFRTVAAALIEAIERIHACGIVLGDLSPGNVFIDPDTLRVSFIDFESAYIVGEDDCAEFSLAWGTAGFADPDRGERKVLTFDDDYYGLGMLLYGAVVPMQNFFALKPSAREGFLEHFVRLGVPAQVREVVFALMRGAPAEAKAVLGAWDAEPSAEALAHA